MEKLIAILEEAVPGVDFQNGTELFTGGILNSLSMVAIIVAVQEEYGIELDFDDITSGNFESAETIMNLIRKYQQA